MTEPHDPRTSATLMGRLRNSADRNAWEQFVQRYGPQIWNWCRGNKLQPADAEDVTQEVLSALAAGMSKFNYDPATGKFRNYLQVVVRRASKSLLDKRAKAGLTGTDDSQASLASVEAREDLAERIAREFDQELLETAKDQVRQRVEPQTWEAFHLTAFECLPADEVAVSLGMQVAAVYMARSRVQKMLRLAVEELEQTG
jgi:RNA polymerase sigma factor (sigma-70 family)